MSPADRAKLVEQLHQMVDQMDGDGLCAVVLIGMVEDGLSCWCGGPAVDVLVLSQNAPEMVGKMVKNALAGAVALPTGAPKQSH